MTTLAALIAEALRDPDVIAALRTALAPPSSDEILPLDRAAEIVGVRTRVIRDAGRRGEIAIEGPRGARVLRRVELDRWLASHRPRPTLRIVDDDPRAEARAAVAAAADRTAGGAR